MTQNHAFTIWLGAFFGCIKCGRFLKVFPYNVKPVDTYRVEAYLDNRTRGICLNNEPELCALTFADHFLSRKEALQLRDKAAEKFGIYNLRVVAVKD
jgi:hypothetical protein